LEPTSWRHKQIVCLTEHLISTQDALYLIDWAIRAIRMPSAIPPDTIRFGNLITHLEENNYNTKIIQTLSRLSGNTECQNYKFFYGLSLNVLNPSQVALVFDRGYSPVSVQL
jgi:hypothetical protein